MIETKQSILKLIKEAEEQFSGTGKAMLDIEDYVAEYLTANGVIVPPCKVGDTLYVQWSYTNAVKKSIYPVKVGIDLSRIEVIRKPFIDTTERVIAELENEYKDL